ncbi:hypothetical protein T484DRAFT_1840082 [Baffinella frigidus]|nr:hypothetical protein T484DRAFT_1840082 [Cryptophyta sp. CCMP2293]
MKGMLWFHEFAEEGFGHVTADGRPRGHVTSAAPEAGPLGRPEADPWGGRGGPIPDPSRGGPVANQEDGREDASRMT